MPCFADPVAFAKHFPVAAGAAERGDSSDPADGAEASQQQAEADEAGGRGATR